jgi:hypothetical protein
MNRFGKFLIAALLGVVLGTGIEQAYSTVTTTAAANPSSATMFSGAFMAGDGSSSAPSYSWTGDPDTGMFHSATGNRLVFSTGGTNRFTLDSSGQRFVSTATLMWSSADPDTTGADLILVRQGSGALAQRNGTNAQSSYIYNTYTDGANYERGYFSWSSNVFLVGTDRAGTGNARNLQFQTDGTTRLSVGSTGQILAITATGGIGYGTGAGSTVTQGVSKSTAATCSAVTCEITMNGAALAANTTVSFTLTNTALAAADQLLCTHHSAGTIGAYTVSAFPAAGSATVALRNVTAGSLSEAVVLKCQIFKGATS